MPPSSNHINPTKPLSLNDRIAVYWPIDDQFFPGVITNLNQDGNVVVHYDDGDVETLSLSDETWKFVQSAEPPRTDSSLDTLPTAPSLPVTKEVPVAVVTKPGKLVFTRRGTPSNSPPKSTEKDDSAVITDVPASRKRPASSSSVVNPVSKKPVTRTREVHGINNSVKNTPSGPVSTAIVAIPPTGEGISARHPKPSPRATLNRTTAKPQLARPITSGVPLSDSKPPPLPPLEPAHQLGQPPPPNFQQALEPLMTSFNAQLNTQVSRISSIRDMLLNLSPRLTELDERCKTLRADVDSLESEVTSRAEMNKLLNDAFMKQMDELNRSQTIMLEQLKKDFRSFLQDEMKAVEKHLVEKIRTKSAEVFKELFRGVAESIKDTAVKNAIEDMSVPTCPSKNTGTK